MKNLQAMVFLNTNLGILKEPLGQYKGTFRNGKKEGKGIYKFSSNITYEGQYKNNQKHGRG